MILYKSIYLYSTSWWFPIKSR